SEPNVEDAGRPRRSFGEEGVAGDLRQLSGRRLFGRAQADHAILGSGCPVSSSDLRFESTHCHPSLLTWPAVFGASARSCVTESLHDSPRFSINQVTLETSFASSGS